MARDGENPSRLRLRLAPLTVLSLGQKAGRHPGRGKNGDRFKFKFAARPLAIGLGSIHHQRFWGQICAHLRPLGKARRKNPENFIKKGAKSGGKWRFCEGQSAIFAELRVDGPGSEAAKLPELTP